MSNQELTTSSVEQTLDFFASKLDSAKKLVEDLLLRLISSARNKDYRVGLALVFATINFYYYRRFTYWSRRNVKAPTPLPFVGNSLSHMRHSYHYLSHEWSEKYGKVYGCYRGARPYMVMADAKVLKQICIKDFDKFTNRHFIDMPSDFNKRSLVFKEDDHWRALRYTLSPTFSTGKIKIMYQIMDKIINKMMNQLDSQASEQIEMDVRDISGKISLGSTIGSLYGIDLSFDPNTNDQNSVQYFAKMSRAAFTPPVLDIIIELLVPHTILKALNWPNLREVKRPAFQFFKNKAKSIINHRLKSGERRNDYLQILIDARESDATDEEISQETQADVEESPNEHHTMEGNLEGVTFRSVSKAKLSENDMICQVVIFMLVATETTVGLIANTLYLLAFNKRIQQRLFDELASIRKVDQDGRVQFNYEDIGSHQYLDCVISESLRLMPPALYLDRKASVDYFLEDYNFTIPKGVPILLDFYGIMTDPDYWPEPEKFNPDRFSPENKGDIVPGSYCPFGIGPRHCIGFRFALTEGKLAIAKLVSEFEFDVAPGAKFPPEPRKPVFIGNAFKSLRTLVRRRDNSQ